MGSLRGNVFSYTDQLKRDIHAAGVHGDAAAANRAASICLLAGLNYSQTYMVFRDICPMTREAFEDLMQEADAVSSQ